VVVDEDGEVMHSLRVLPLHEEYDPLREEGHLTNGIEVHIKVAGPLESVVGSIEVPLIDLRFGYLQE
jgi:hypothetical protein